jgi:hypothetical protein
VEEYSGKEKGKYQSFGVTRRGDRHLFVKESLQLILLEEFPLLDQSRVQHDAAEDGIHWLVGQLSWGGSAIRGLSGSIQNG